MSRKATKILGAARRTSRDEHLEARDSIMCEHDKAIKSSFGRRLHGYYVHKERVPYSFDLCIGKKRTQTSCRMTFSRRNISNKKYRDRFIAGGCKGELWEWRVSVHDKERCYANFTALSRTAGEAIHNILATQDVLPAET